MQRNEGDLAEEIAGLRRYARLLVRDPAEADDLVQDCLVRALEKWRAVAGVRDLRRYLFSILHNLHIDGTRTRNRRGPAIPIEAAGSVVQLTQPANQNAHIEVADMRAALDKLPEAQRRVILLVGLSGFSYEETAEITGAPLGTVMSRLSRGREALRRHMAGEEITADAEGPEGRRR